MVKFWQLLKWPLRTPRVGTDDFFWGILTQQCCSSSEAAEHMDAGMYASSWDRCLYPVASCSVTIRITKLSLFYWNKIYGRQNAQILNLWRPSTITGSRGPSTRLCNKIPLVFSVKNTAFLPITASRLGSKNSIMKLGRGCLLVGRTVG